MISPAATPLAMVYQVIARKSVTASNLKLIEFKVVGVFHCLILFKFIVAKYIVYHVRNNSDDLYWKVLK